MLFRSCRRGIATKVDVNGTLIDAKKYLKSLEAKKAKASKVTKTTKVVKKETAKDVKEK